MEMNLADRMSNLNGSATREILKLTADPTIISFAGGMPGKDCFPTESIAEITQSLLTGNRAVQLLQYGTTDGLPSVREAMTSYVQDFGIKNAEANNILMISGGQQALDLCCKAFLNKGDTCLVENPTYLTMLQILNSYEAKAVGVASVKDGLDIYDLEDKIKKTKPKMLYIVPTFSNPTGNTYTLENRRKIAEITAKYNVLVIEDDPYSKLRYTGETLSSIKGLTNADNVLFVTSFSKIISPGLRVGFACGHKDLIRKLEICKQGVDVHTPNLNQAICEEFVRRNILNHHISKVLPIYKQKKDNMILALKKYMTKEMVYSDVEGGLFIWAKFTNNINTVKMFENAVKQKVAYVFGQVFYADGKGQNTLRLNFSNASPENIDKGIQALAQVVAEESKAVQ